MANKGVIITGGTRGFGRALSLEFALADFEVHAIYRHDKQSANDLEIKMKQLSREFTLHQHNVAFGPPKFELPKWDEIIVIHNATAPFTPSAMHAIDWTQFQRHFDISVKALYDLFQWVLFHRTYSASIQLISVLTNAMTENPRGFSPYLTGKFALDGLTRSIAADYGNRNVKAYSVSPGFMKTHLTDHWHVRNLQPNDPMVYARQVVELAQDANTEGEGETYELQSHGHAHRHAS